MSGIPPLPPLRIKEADGSPNVIPVFQITLSNGLTLTNEGGGKVKIDGSGSQGPAGPAGTVTIGSGITGGATPGFLLIVSDGSVIGQIDSGTFQRAISFPITTGSGGTGRTTVGSAHTVLGVNSDGTTLSYYAILGSNNAVVTKVGTAIFVTATTPTPIVYAATDNKYVVLDLATDLTNEFRLVQSGNSITVSTAAGLVTINATTQNISTKQDSLNIPLIVGSGGTGTTASGSATTLVGMNSSGAVYDYYLLVGSNSTTVTRSGTSYVISTVTSGAAAGGGNGVVNAGSAGNLAYYVQAGTAVDDLLIGSANTILGVNSSGAINEYKTLVAGNNISFTYVTTGITISASTGVVSTVFAATGNAYVVTDLASDLTNDFRLIQSGNSITVSTAGNNIIINAVTGNLSVKQDSITFPLITGSGGTGRTTVGSAHTLLGVNSDGSSLSYYAILASDNATVVKSGTAIFISAVTNAAGAGGGSGTVNPGSAGNLTYYAQAGTAVYDLVIGSAGGLVGVNSSGASHQYFHIKASDNATVVVSGTGIFISATTTAAGGSGTVQTGSENCLAYYPAFGTTVSGSLITLTDGAGIATWNVPLLTSGAANSVSGDVWIQSSANRLYLFARSNNANYFVAMNT